MSSGPKRPYEQVFPIAQGIVGKLSPYCDRIELAGSLRRGRPLIGDIEIVALPRLIHNLVGDVIGSELDHFLGLAGINFARNGPRYKAFPYGKYTVELFLPASPAHWGSIMTIRTGSAAFSKWLVDEAAFHAGAKFQGGRLYRGGQALATPEEADIFEALGLPWIPPQERDDKKWLRYWQPEEKAA